MRTRMPYTRVAGLALACFLVGANAMAAGAQATTDTTLVKEFPPEALKAVGGEKLDVGAGKAEKFAIPPVPDDPLTYVRGSDNVRGSDQDLQEGLKFNFRGVPLDTVLDYLSRAAGFVIVRDTQVSGNVDVVSHQPLNKDEAFMLLNTLLNQKGLAAIRNERTLTIVKRDEARTRDLPVRVGAEPEAIPKTDEMVTQILPVRYANVTQLLQNIQALLPDYATISANEGTNSILLTDTQINIRRIAEIIKALDTSVSGSSAMRVYKMNRANATEMATLINTLFSSQGGGSGSPLGSGLDRARMIGDFINRMRGGGGGPPGGGMPGGGFFGGGPPGGFPGGGPPGGRGPGR